MKAVFTLQLQEVSVAGGHKGGSRKERFGGQAGPDFWEG